MIFNKDVPFREKKNFLLYLISRIILNIGYLIYIFAVSYVILSVTESALLFAINIVIGTVANILVLPFTGVTSDKYRKKIIILSGETIITLFLSILFIITIITGFNLVIIYLTTFILSIINPFVSNAYQVALTEMFDASRIQKVMGHVAAILSVSMLAGPILGGVLFGFFSFHYIILIFFIAYVMTTFLDLFIDFNLYKPKIDEIYMESTNDDDINMLKNFKNELLLGFRYLQNKKFLLRIFIMALFINFFAAIVYILPEKIMIVEYNLEPFSVGLVNSIASIGTFISGTVIGFVKQIKNPIRLQKYSLYLWGLMIFSYLLPVYFSTNSLSIIIMFGVIGFIISGLLQLINIPLFTYLQLTIPHNIKGRVFSVLTLITNSISPLGMIVFAMLYDALPYWLINSVSFILILILVTYFLNKNVLNQSKQDMVNNNVNIN